MGDKGARGQKGEVGPAGVSGDVEIESRVSRVDTAETSLSSICDALNFADDSNLNGVCWSECNGRIAKDWPLCCLLISEDAGNADGRCCMERV